MDNLIKKSGANHWKSLESVGGHLYLTSTDLIFKAHSINIEIHETVIPLKEIKEITFNNNLLIVQNGITVTLISGQVEKFVIQNRKEWTDAIEREANVPI